MIIECVPLPKDIGDMAPVYFKVSPCDADNSIDQSQRYLAKRGKTDTRYPKQGVDFWLENWLENVARVF